ncbi:hypothetical protein DW643_18355, partial [Escherichia coli]
SHRALSEHKTLSISWSHYRRVKESASEKRKTRSRSQMHCIHIINRFKIISSLFRNSPDNLL